MAKHFWTVLVITGIVFAFITGAVQPTQTAGLEAGKATIELMFGIVGGFAFWMGLLNIAKKAGLTYKLAKKLHPIIGFLYPEIKNDKDSMESISLNMSCNMLGIGNAATPAGLKAMKEMQRLNKKPDTAMNAMCMLLVVNASSVQLIPTGILTLRTMAGSADPGNVYPAILFATMCSTITGIVAVKFFEKWGKV